MNETHNFPDEENPEQDIYLENEILKLKLMAEHGGKFGPGDSELPVELEYEFLQNVEAFEAAYDKAPSISIYEHIGRPIYIPPHELKEEEVQPEIKRLMALLNAKNVLLHVFGKYDLSIIYKFIIEELFPEEIKPVDHPGYLLNFIYEQYHPNDFVGIEMTGQQFIRNWLRNGFNEYSDELADTIITADAKLFSRSQMIQKLQNCLNSYKSFTDINIKEPDISFEWNEEKSKGLGHAEGIISYDAVLENNETIHIEGGFKLYMSNEDGCWRIFYFIFPGFAW